MKKEYTRSEIEIVRFEEEDIITSSNCPLETERIPVG